MRTNCLIIKIFALFLLVPFQQTYAAFLKNVPQVIVQPDGRNIVCYASGDEFWHWLHDSNGYTIIQNEHTGYFVYALELDGKLVPSDFIVGENDPQNCNLKPFATLSPENLLKKHQLWEKRNRTDVKSELKNNKGRLNNIVVFIKFLDDSDFTNLFSVFEQMFNGSSETDNSMYKYYQRISYNSLEIVTSFYPLVESDVVETYTDDKPRSYYQPFNSETNTNGYSGSDQKNAREFALLRNALLSVKGEIPSGLDIDFDKDGKIDNVCFIVKGGPDGWSDLLWPHMSTIDDNYSVTINEKQFYSFNFQLETYVQSHSSVLCHEMFHTLGAPDLYHYTYGTSLHPVGYWDLMEYNSEPAQSTNAYMKFKYGGWIDSLPEIKTTGTYGLAPLSSNVPENICYKINIPNSTSGEFLILEYRVNENTYESALPGSGLLVYRIWPHATGNVSYNGADIFDEVYAFRPGGKAFENGDMDNAFFSDSVYRTTFLSDMTDPTFLLTDGDYGNIAITNIKREVSGKISFRIVFPDEPYLAVVPESLTMGANVGLTNAAEVITDASDWGFALTESWLHAEKSDDGLKFTITEGNVSLNERKATITVSSNGIPDNYVTIIQSGAQAFLTVAPRNQTIGGIGSTAEFDVSTNIDDWHATTSYSWIELKKSGDGKKLIVTAIENNEGYVERQAIIKVSGNGLQSNLFLTQQVYTSINTNKNLFSISPNPSNGLIHIRFDNNLPENCVVRIYNLLGNVIYENHDCINNETIEVRLNVSEGIYFIQVGNKEPYYTTKILIKQTTTN